MNMRNRVAAWLASLAVLVGVFPVGAQAATGFDDVADGHTFAEPIVWLAQEGITRGCNPPANTKFCPDARVTRGQMAAFLVRALGLEASKATFADTKGHVFAADVAALADAGITKGCNPPKNTKFCPDDYVTRGQMAAFLVRAFGLKPGKASFSDTKGHVFQADVAALADAGITKGCNPPKNTEFCPDDYVTRGQMAAFLYRAFDTGSKGSGSAETPSAKPRRPVCRVDLKTIVPSKKIAAYGKQFNEGKMSFGEMVEKSIIDGGEFVQWIVSEGSWDFNYALAFGGDSIYDFVEAYRIAVEAAQTLPMSGERRDLVLGVDAGCGSWEYAGPSKSVALKRVSSHKMPKELRDLVDHYAGEHLVGSDGDAGLASLVWGLNSYVLSGLLEDTLFGGESWALPHGKTFAAWHHMFFVEMYLLELKENHPDAWKQMRANGWSDILAAAWNQAQGVWPKDSGGSRELYDLVFGKHYRIIAEFTDGKAGTNPPLRPK